MAPPPPPLVDDAVEEILLRLPPADPPLLLHAALVCKRWRRRFREFHRSAPMLGIFCEVFRPDFGGLRFVPTSASSCPPLAECHPSWSVLDSRHGRVLLDASDLYSERNALVVWDPISDERRPRDADCSLTGAVLCAGDAATGGTCEHLSCRHGPFVVVLVINNSGGEGIYAYMYSSEAGEWSELEACPSKVRYLVPGALLCFGEQQRDDLGARQASVIAVPSICKRVVPYVSSNGEPSSLVVEPRLVLVTMDDGQLGFARKLKKFLSGYGASVAPLTSFYTPDLGVASSADGTGADGSSA